MFDPRADIWFSADDKALATLRDIEQKFVAQDLVFAAFEERNDPHGVFGEEALERIARVTAKLKSLPFVRNVRSLTENPWIRWGEVAPDEDGLIVSDLFEQPPGSYSEDERLYRMVVTLGARPRRRPDRRAQGARLARPGRPLRGPHRRAAAPAQRWSARMAAPPRSRSRSCARRSRMSSWPRCSGDQPSHGKGAAPAIHTSATQSRVLDQVDLVLHAEEEVRWHLAGIPVLERYFPIVSKGDMPYIGLLILAVIVILYVLYRRLLCVAIPMLVMIASILGMNGTVWLMGDLMTNLTAVAPNVLIAVGIGNSVHLLTAYFAQRARHRDKRALIQAVLRQHWMPALITTTTTAIGFFSLMTSRIGPMSGFGYTLGFGSIYAYLLSMTVVPAMLSLLPIPKSTAATAEAAEVAEVPRPPSPRSPTICGTGAPGSSPSPPGITGSSSR